MWDFEINRKLHCGLVVENSFCDTSPALSWKIDKSCQITFFSSLKRITQGGILRIYLILFCFYSNIVQANSHTLSLSLCKIDKEILISLFTIGERSELSFIIQFSMKLNSPPRQGFFYDKAYKSLPKVFD